MVIMNVVVAGVAIKFDGANTGAKYELNRLEITWGSLAVDLTGGC